MKTKLLLLLFPFVLGIGVFFYFFPNTIGENNPTIIATFDAYEGEHYIFTDQSNKAILLKVDDEEKVLKDFDLKNNEHIGETFKINYANKNITKISPLNVSALDSYATQ